MIPFISWGAKWCSIQSLHIIILTRGMSFPTSKSLQCRFWFKCAAHCVDRGTFGACAWTKQRRKRAYAPDARLWIGIPARLRQKVREKILDRFLPNLWWIGCYAGRLRPVSEPASELNQQESKWSPNEGGIYTNSPVWSPICLHSSRRCVSKKWVLTCPVGLC